ncbi:uncharacterized protein LOC101856741 [Aplysia californica]|uniref:Uncharacterized protein LOC101856741 n=1 Tax=Aplysia californica TaxID=6500 RepID=A0ABM0JSK9_APLCA|nr:uncharacterized protein LOC101856741 [Aplysia californica]
MYISCFITGRPHVCPQLRERASTDCEFRHLEDKERKLSLPFSIHLLSRNKQKKAEPPGMPSSPKLPRKNVVSSPKPSRFSVEPVKEAECPDGELGNSAAKTRRSGHSNITFQNSDKVSRVPELSAIEEGGTVTSIRQLVTRQSSSDSAGLDDLEDSPTFASTSQVDAPEASDNARRKGYDSFSTRSRKWIQDSSQPKRRKSCTTELPPVHEHEEAHAHTDSSSNRDQSWAFLQHMESIRRSSDPCEASSRESTPGRQHPAIPQISIEEA